MVLNPNDILEELGTHKIKQITIDELGKQQQNNINKIKDIKEEYKEIYKVLNEALNINEISEKTGMDITEIYSKLFMMELEGLIEQKENKYKII